jgi:hypothetical protein
MMIDPHPHPNDQIKRVPKYGKILDTQYFSHIR